MVFVCTSMERIKSEIDECIGRCRVDRAHYGIQSCLDVSLWRCDRGILSGLHIFLLHLHE